MRNFASILPYKRRELTPIERLAAESHSKDIVIKHKDQVIEELRIDLDAERRQVRDRDKRIAILEAQLRRKRELAGVYG